MDEASKGDATLSVPKVFVFAAVRKRSARTRACCSLPVSLLMYIIFCASFLWHTNSTTSFTFESAVVSELVVGSLFADSVYSRDSWATWLRDSYMPLILGLGDGTAGEDAQVIGGYALPLGGIRLVQTREALAACPDPVSARIYGGTCYSGAGSGAVGDAAAGAPAPASAFVPTNLPYERGAASYQLLVSTVSDLATAQAIVDGLTAGAWTDAGTRTLSAQVALLNAQPGVNLWGILRFDAVFTPGGLVRVTSTVNSFPDAAYGRPWGSKTAGFIVFLDITLVAYALYLGVGTLRRVVGRTSKARGLSGKLSALLLDPWLLIDYFTCGCVWGTIGNWGAFASEMGAIRKLIDDDALATPAVYASGDRTGFLISLLNARDAYVACRFVAAWCVILLALRQFKYLQYQSRLAVMSQSLSMAAGDSVAFSLLLTIILSCYGVWGMGMFGSQAPDWQDAHVTINSLFRYMMYDYDLTAMEAVDVDMGRFFFASYMLLVTNMVLWMFLAIFLESYTAVRTASHKGNSVGEDAEEAAVALGMRLRTCPPWRRGGCCSLVPHGIAEGEAFLAALGAGDLAMVERVTLAQLQAAARSAASRSYDGPASVGSKGSLDPFVVRSLFEEALSLESAEDAGMSLPGLAGVSSREDGEEEGVTHRAMPLHRGSDVSRSMLHLRRLGSRLSGGSGGSSTTLTSEAARSGLLAAGAPLPTYGSTVTAL